MFVYVLYNTCYGGFGLSDSAIELLARKKQGMPDILEDRYRDYPRHDPDVVQVEVVRELGNKANGRYANISIAQVPEKYQDYYTIREYDGYESVSVNHGAYQLDRIRNITEEETGSAEAKLAAIKEALAEPRESLVFE